jgi:hypothetical protein
MMDFNTTNPTAGGLPDLQANAVANQGQPSFVPGQLSEAASLGINGITGEQLNPGMFQKGGLAQMGLGAISTIGNLWNSFQQNKIAKETLSFQKDAYKTNLGNQTQSYNTALEGRIRSRYDFEGKSDKSADTYIDKNKL